MMNPENFRETAGSLSPELMSVPTDGDCLLQVATLNHILTGRAEDFLFDLAGKH